MRLSRARRKHKLGGGLCEACAGWAETVASSCCAVQVSCSAPYNSSTTKNSWDKGWWVQLDNQCRSGVPLSLGLLPRVSRAGSLACALRLCLEKQNIRDTGGLLCLDLSRPSSDDERVVDGFIRSVQKLTAMASSSVRSPPTDTRLATTAVTCRFLCFHQRILCLCPNPMPTTTNETFCISGFASVTEPHAPRVSTADTI